MDDTRLYLDTHPDCKEAFIYYKKMEKIRNDAIKEYEIHCGSILSYRANETGSEYFRGQMAAAMEGGVNLCGLMKKEHSIR